MHYGGGLIGSILLIAVGFVVLHFATKENSLFLKIAGYILAAGGALVLIYALFVRFSGTCPACGGQCMRGRGMMGPGMGMMGGPGMGMGMMGQGMGMGPGMGMRFASECVKEINGKVITADNMAKFHDCMMKNMPEPMKSSPMHKAMMENMNECTSKLTGKTMDANTMLEMHNCMMQERLEE